MEKKKRRIIQNYFSALAQQISLAPKFPPHWICMYVTRYRNLPPWLFHVGGWDYAYLWNNMLWFIAWIAIQIWYFVRHFRHTQKRALFPEYIYDVWLKVFISAEHGFIFFLFSVLAFRNSSTCFRFKQLHILWINTRQPSPANGTRNENSVK